MPRVKRGIIHNKRRRKILRAAKGYRQGRRKLIKAAKVAILKAGKNAYRDRRAKKRLARRLWQIKINAALRAMGTSYSKFIGQCKKQNIELDRKILAELAEKRPNIFKALCEKMMK